MNPTPASTATKRLPGSVAEIQASRPGPEVAAFFDLDGTLVAGFTGVALTQDRLRRRDLGAAEMATMILAGLNHRLGRSDFEQLVSTASAGLRGRVLSDLDELGERLFARTIQNQIYPEMRDLVHAHLERGHTVVLTTSALTIQAAPVARFLGIEHILSNRFQTDESGILTGAVAKPVIWGPGKAHAAQTFATERGVDLTQSYFYADGDEDVSLMYLVGHPRPTNPAGRMAAVARKRGWPILSFTSRGGGGLAGQLRVLAGVGAFVPPALGGLGLGLLTRNRRRGVNFFMSTWPRLMLSASGVRMNVVGTENLHEVRPAVFIFNHRNNFDPLITAALIRDDWTGVAKKELADDPIAGTMGRLMDSIFIDRDDTSSAVNSLQEAEQLAQKGLSILIAPEGSRIDDTDVGPFKKGAFRIAMAAGIPVVPVVIRNAESIAARDAGTIHPGTVDVAVFPPLPVAHWTPDELPERIAAVRQLYVDTLRDWPTGSLPRSAIYDEAVRPTVVAIQGRPARAKKKKASVGDAKGAIR